ncbi:glycosyltransferase family A protein (plasmid) [Priestia aryabhattai]|uniref:glycosyltransferase family 2 protein n=1 Tax=Priestia aryabhattai TaxID=412384 RepID=UPI0025A38E77|nr:glycosyltransferase family A protein [Priestia aryabhattai]WJN47664.1 glycosyltransferase family A protein [Priestia aryabhattai]
MRDIQIFLVGYVNSSSIKKAVDSLHFINNRINEIIILDIPETLLQSGMTFEDTKIQCINLINNDLGLTLNYYIHGLSCEYVMFLYSYDYLNDNVMKHTLTLNDKKGAMTYDFIINNKVIKRPFLIKTSFLKQNPFLSKSYLPFKESVLPSWLSQINELSILPSPNKLVNQVSIDKTSSHLQKLNFIEKYQQKLETQNIPPSITVMIANYNMGNYVGIAINSCILQSSLPEQILVVDDGSNDHSLEIIKSFKNTPGFRFLSKDNGGKAKALNAALSYVETEFVMELDADDWLDPDAFYTIRRCLENLKEDVAVLYGNLRAWKQNGEENIRYKGLRKGRVILNRNDLLSYVFPLGPRIYRTSTLKQNNGFPLIDFEGGRMYEDVSVLNDLIKTHRLLYKDMTVYNVREHPLSITKKNHSSWSDFLKYLD